MSLASYPSLELVIDVFDSSAVFCVFNRTHTSRTMVVSTVQPMRADATKATCEESLRRALNEIKKKVQLVRPSVLISVHSDLRVARHGHIVKKFKEEQKITATTLQDFLTYTRESFSAQSNVSIIEVNGYPTRIPLQKMGTRIGGFVSQYDDQPFIKVLAKSCESIFGTAPTFSFFIEQAVAMLPKTHIPFTFFVLGKVMSEYCVVRDGVVREVIGFEWGTDDLPSAHASTTEQVPTQSSQETVEGFWGAISKEKSVLPLPSDYVCLQYDLHAAPEMVVEALMGGVYTATGSPMKKNVGTLGEASTRLFSTPEMRARSQLDAQRVFSFPV